MIEFFVEGIPVPAVRQSRRDSWEPRDVVIRYHSWRDRVVLAFRATFPGMKILKPVEMGFTFYLPDWPICDLDNLIKGVKDALVRGEHLQDDTWRWVSGYRYSQVINVCLDCEKKRGKECKVKECSRAGALIQIYEPGEVIFYDSESTDYRPELNPPPYRPVGGQYE